MDHRSRTTRRTALFADTLEDDSPEHPTPYLSFSPSLSFSHTLAPIFSPLSSELSSLSRPFPARPHDSDSYSRRSVLSHSPRMFRLRRSITVGSLRFYRYRQGRPLRSRGRDLSALTIAGRCIADRRIKWRGRIARISRSFRTDKRTARWESRAPEKIARARAPTFGVASLLF